MDTTANTLAELRKESQSIFNRIHSIAEDAVFVKQVHDHYPELPLLPNMRCGAWYTDLSIASIERAYFKSTDGHTNNWSFNLRRPNLHLLPLITEHGGLVLVDSTRAGKRIPDALSKTIPIWCAVINRAILKRATETIESRIWDTVLYTPPGSVSPQEHSQIEARLDGWASELAASSYRLPTLERPLHPIWITPATTVFPTLPSLADRAFYPIVCVSASKQVMDGMERRASGFAYIQGSGDDHELWSMGLTPILYWKHCDQILSTKPFDLPVFVRSLVSTSSNTDDATQCLRSTPIHRISGRISVCSVTTLRQSYSCQDHPDFAFLCLTSEDPERLAGTMGSSKEDPPRILCIQTPGGKKGQHHFLATVLPLSIPFIRYHLQHHRTVCIACDTGTDMSVGVALAALALFFRSDGSIQLQEHERDKLCTCLSNGTSYLDARIDAIEVAKDVLKTRLQWIISSYPQANPSRTTLKRVNDFLLSPFSNPSTLGTESRPEDTSIMGERTRQSLR